VGPGSLATFPPRRDRKEPGPEELDRKPFVDATQFFGKSLISSPCMRLSEEIRRDFHASVGVRVVTFRIPTIYKRFDVRRNPNQFFQCLRGYISHAHASTTSTVDVLPGSSSVMFDPTDASMNAHRRSRDGVDRILLNSFEPSTSPSLEAWVSSRGCQRSGGNSIVWGHYGHGLGAPSFNDPGGRKHVLGTFQNHSSGR